MLARAELMTKRCKAAKTVQRMMRRVLKIRSLETKKRAVVMLRAITEK